MKKLPLLLMLATPAFGQTPEATPHFPTFETLNEAAVKALSVAYQVSHYYEVGGVILKMADGTYAIARPRTDLSGDSLTKIDMDPMGYPGEIAADYHTHPCNSTTHIPSVFSPDDLRSNRSYKSIGYVADLCTGKVMVYDPAVDKLTPMETMEGWAGHQVGQFVVDGVVLDTNLGVVL